MPELVLTHCTTTGAVNGNTGSGKLIPLPFTWMLDLLTVLPFWLIDPIPSLARSLSLYFEPVVLISVQHGIPLHMASPDTPAFRTIPVLSYTHSE